MDAISKSSITGLASRRPHIARTDSVAASRRLRIRVDYDVPADPDIANVHRTRVFGGRRPRHVPADREFPRAAGCGWLPGSALGGAHAPTRCATSPPRAADRSAVSNPVRVSGAIAGARCRQESASPPVLTPPAAHDQVASAAGNERVVVILGAVIVDAAARGDAIHQAEDERLDEPVEHVRHACGKEELTAIDKYTANHAHDDNESADPTPTPHADLGKDRVRHVCDHQDR